MREVNEKYAKNDENSEETVVFNEFIEEVLSLVPEPIANRYRTLPAQAYSQDERTLRTLLNPSEQQRMLRTRLWQLLNERLGVPGAPRISEGELCRGVCNTEYLTTYSSNPYVVAWLVCPTLDYNTRVESLLESAYDRMREILEVPLYTEKGEVDAKAANLLLQVTKILDLRARGNYTERIEQKTLNVSATAKEARALFGGEVLSLEQIEERIKLLEGGKG